jgi:hypothetical protein
MRGRRLAMAIVVTFAWLVALYLAMAPVDSDYGTPERPRNAVDCPRPFSAALDPSNTLCGPGSRERVGWLAWWLVMTGGLSTAFIAMRPVAAGDAEPTE